MLCNTKMKAYKINHQSHSKFPSSLCHKAAALTFFLAIIIVLHGTTTIALDSVKYRDNEAEKIALLTIKSKLVDQPAGVLSSWNHSLHHCLWDGVICGHKHNRVIVLDLYSRDLEGTISPSIGNLSFLRKIDLSNNSLHGRIPSEIGYLFRLQSLLLSNNTLTGEVPNNISGCTNLQILDLGVNKLKGMLPLEIGALSKLNLLALHFNDFSGSLFKVIANLTSLETISTTYNAFTGVIPDSIGRMRNLTRLAVGANQLSGRIPASIFNLSALLTLEFSGNNLHGSLPQDIAFNFPQLQILGVAENYLSGPFPISISNLTSLEYIALAMNNFTGPVPRDFGHLQNLQGLYISYNNLQGDINFISTFVNCSNLGRLDLEGNYFTGLLPKSLANFSTTLTALGIGNNLLSGKIPTGIGNLVNLVYLSLNANGLTGTIPRDLVRLQSLELVYLNSNELTGNIPDSFTSSSHLSTLYLDNNRFQGNIPPSLGNCQNLLYLGLSSNDLVGILPNKLFEGSTKFLEINLSRNHLEGSLPLEISKQLNLVKLDVSQNEFSGGIPNGLAYCSALQHLNMAGNSFHGPIPQTFNSLSSLQTIDLSHNNLSGPIPDYFSKFPLIRLNLSFNNFEDMVPTKGVFANAANISLVGNSRLCGGNSDLHLQRCVGKERKRRKLSRALIITTICAIIGVLSVAACIWLYMTCHKKEKERVQSSSMTIQSFFKVSYSMLLKATDEFSHNNLLGAGSFGSVFKGVLEGKTVAVKVLNLQHQGGSKSFMAECEALRSIRHRNLVGIITACSSMDFQRNDFKALVYEFMSNESLDRWIHEDGNLTLHQRVDIAIDVACALNYLHYECENPIVHCDLKPSNILLDDDMVAHVADFGLAKILAQPVHPTQSSSVGVRGTIGYVAPEYGLGKDVYPEADVYSYGILLLELMTRKRPTNKMFKEDYNLHMYSKAALPDRVLEIVDFALLENGSEEAGIMGARTQEKLQKIVECLVSVVKIGVACSNQSPKDRMKITTAISELRQVKNILNPKKLHKLPRGDQMDLQ